MMSYQDLKLKNRFRLNNCNQLYVSIEALRIAIRF